MARDYYEVLGVPRNASQEELQAAYRRLSRSLHPDVNKDPSAEERFKEVGEAYRVLSDPESRARYDGMRARGGRPGPRPRAGTGGRAGQGRGFGGGPRPGPGGRGSGVFTTDDLGGIDLEDLLGDLFGAGGPIPGADQEAELVLTVEEAYAGGRRWVTLAGPEGSRNYEVSIPPGVVDGQRIRLAGEGGRGSGEAPAGDLYLVVRIAPPHGRPPWARPSRSTPPAARSRCGSRRAPPAAAGCGCAARGCRTPGARRATSTPRSP